MTMLKLILIMVIVVGVELALFFGFAPKHVTRRQALGFNVVAVAAALLLALTQLMYLNFKADPEAPGTVYWAFKVLNSIPAFTLGLIIAWALRRFWYFRARS